MRTLPGPRVEEPQRENSGQVSPHFFIKRCLFYFLCWKEVCTAELFGASPGQPGRLEWNAFWSAYMLVQHQPGTMNASLHVHQAAVGLIHCYCIAVHVCMPVSMNRNLICSSQGHSVGGSHGFLWSSSTRASSLCLMKANSHSWVGFAEFASDLQLFPPYFFFFFQWRCGLLSYKVKLLTTGFVSLVSFSFATSLGIVHVCPRDHMLKTTPLAK